MSDPIAQYQVREMLALMRQRPRPTTFLSNLFVKSRRTSKTKYLEIDQIFGGQMVAGYVNRQGGPNVVGKGGYQTLIHVAPYVYEQLAYTPSDVDTRMAGNTVYDDVDPVAMLVAEWLADLEDRFVRLEELQVAEALQDGIITVQGKDVDYTVDFQQSAEHKKTLTGDDRWGEVDEDILGNLRDWNEEIIDTGAPAPDVLIGDTKSIALLKANDEIRSLLDNRRIDTGAINPRQIRDQRATYEGRLAGSGFDVDIYTYQGMYQSIDSGVKTNHRYMDEYTVILASTSMDFRFHYGKIENFKAPGFMGTRFPNRWESQDGKQRFITMESGPMAGLHQPDAVIRCKVAG